MSKKRVGIYLTEKTLEICDSNIERFDVKSRSDLTIYKPFPNKKGKKFMV